MQFQIEFANSGGVSKPLRFIDKCEPQTNLQIGRAEFANSKLNLQIQFEFANYLQIQFEFANWCGFSEILNALYLFKHGYFHMAGIPMAPGRHPEDST